VSFIHKFVLKLPILGNNKTVVKPQHVPLIYSKVLGWFFFNLLFDVKYPFVSFLAFYYLTLQGAIDLNTMQHRRVHQIKTIFEQGLHIQAM
jgi:hypothetical protein